MVLQLRKTEIESLFSQLRLQASLETYLGLDVRDSDINIDTTPSLAGCRNNCNVYAPRSKTIQN